MEKLLHFRVMNCNECLKEIVIVSKLASTLGAPWVANRCVLDVYFMDVSVRTKALQKQVDQFTRQQDVTGQEIQCIFSNYWTGPVNRKTGDYLTSRLN